MSKRTDGKVGPWAKEKLDALRQYLSFYTTVLKKQGRWLKGTIFVDAFAGPGSSPIRSKAKSDLPSFFEQPEEQIEFVNGSPRVALDIDTPFSAYVFIEKSAKRITELKALKEEYGTTRDITVVEGDANKALMDWLSSGIDWKKHRAVVFIDPFGMQVAWSTIEALAATGAIEVIINFPLDMAIQRLLKKSGDIPESWQKSLDTSFGSTEWRNLVYEETEDLFGAKTQKKADSGFRLLGWYSERLKKAFGHVSSPRMIKNTRGLPLYYLIWAGPHPKGLDGAEHILSKGEKLKGKK